MKDSEKLVYLLYHAPDKFIIEVQPIIKFTIDYFKNNKSCNCEFEDMLQHINAELIEKKIPLMQKKYNSNYKISTYLIQIVKNLCYDYLNKHYNFNEVQNEIEPISYQDDYELKLVIESELNYLGYILKLFGNKKEKLKICLKVIYKIPFDSSLLRKHFSFLTENEIKLLTNKINYNNKTNLQVFDILIPYFNRKENKENSANSLRRWTNLKILEIIRLFNTKKNKRYYNKETLGLLLEKYFSKISYL